MPTLTYKTRDIRLNKMRELMAHTRVDALIFTSADFFQWATNFHVDVQTWERPIAVCIPATGEPFAVMNELSTNHMRFARERKSVWLEDVSFYAEHPKTSDRQPLLAQLPELKLISLTAEVRELRWVKTQEELVVMRAAASLSDWVQDRYRENIRPDRLVQELDFQMASAMVEEGARRFPGENLEVLRCWTLSGPPSASPHGDGASCGARIKAGDGLVNIVIPRLNGIVIENERTWFCGKPTSDQAKYYEVARAANAAALEAAVTGRPVSGIDAAAQQVIENAGCGSFIKHRTGHGMGVIGHEFPEDMAFNHRALRADEVYSAEPGLYVFGLGGFRLDDSVVVGEVPEILTNTPKTLAHATIA